MHAQTERILYNIVHCKMHRPNVNDLGLTEEKQEAQLMLITGSTRLAVSQGQQTWYHSTCNI